MHSNSPLIVLPNTFPPYPLQAHIPPLLAAATALSLQKIQFLELHPYFSLRTQTIDSSALQDSSILPTLSIDISRHDLLKTTLNSPYATAI